jgi:hypothetical protein
MIYDISVTYSIFYDTFITKSNASTIISRGLTLAEENYHINELQCFVLVSQQVTSSFVRSFTDSKDRHFAFTVAISKERAQWIISSLDHHFPRIVD